MNLLLEIFNGNDNVIMFNNEPAFRNIQWQCQWLCHNAALVSFSTQPKTLLPGLNSCRATGPARRRQRARLVADIVVLAVLVDLLHFVVLMKRWSPRRPSRRLEQDRGKQSPPSQSNFTLNRSSHCVVVQLNSSFSLSRPSSVGQHHCDLQNTLLAFFTGKYGENCHNISSYPCPSRDKWSKCI